MPSRKNSIQRRALFLEVADQLRAMIVQGALKPGEKISENDLCEQFGISRTPLREALKVLASEELIDLLPNRGTRVSTIDESHVKDLFELVAVIEGAAAEFAVMRMTDNDLAHLVDMHERMARHFEQRQLKRYFNLNQAIHNYIVTMSMNEVMQKAHSQLMDKVTRARFFAILSPERWETSMAEHTQILDALKARNGPLAGKLHRRHVEETGEFICRSLQDGGADFTL